MEKKAGKFGIGFEDSEDLPLAKWAEKGRKRGREKEEEPGRKRRKEEEEGEEWWRQRKDTPEVTRLKRYLRAAGWRPNYKRLFRKCRSQRELREALREPCARWACTGPPPWLGAAVSAGAARKKPNSPRSTPPTFYQPDPAEGIRKIPENPPRSRRCPPRIGRGSAASSAPTASEGRRNLGGNPRILGVWGETHGFWGEIHGFWGFWGKIPDFGGKSTDFGGFGGEILYFGGKSPDFGGKSTDFGVKFWIFGLKSRILG
ncbi:34 kDa spicule matrix protein-like [Poecile atricapillus]|uniref:34 kDa spicule matrix protein-like n=1 Tax=Poecile atricapillus TaxID=48891 RepID=UPI002739A793|nr:34 kDa spicule matrix protein-like [Poecile atricapillus]